VIRKKSWSTRIIEGSGLKPGIMGFVKLIIETLKYVFKGCHGQQKGSSLKGAGTRIISMDFIGGEILDLRMQRISTSPYSVSLHDRPKVGFPGSLCTILENRKYNKRNSPRG